MSSPSSHVFSFAFLVRSNSYICEICQIEIIFCWQTVEINCEILSLMNLMGKFSLSWVGLGFHSRHLPVWNLTHREADIQSRGDTLNRLSSQSFLKRVSPMICGDILFSPKWQLAFSSLFLPTELAPGYTHSGLLIMLGDDCYRNRSMLAEEGMVGKIIVTTHVLEVSTFFRGANWDHLLQRCRYISGHVLS